MTEKNKTKFMHYFAFKWEVLMFYQKFCMYEHVSLLYHLLLMWFILMTFVQKVLLWKDYKSKFTECLKTAIFKEKNKWKYLFCGSKYMKPYQH